MLSLLKTVPQISRSLLADLLADRQDATLAFARDRRSAFGNFDAPRCGQGGGVDVIDAFRDNRLQQALENGPCQMHRRQVFKVARVNHFHLGDGAGRQLRVQAADLLGQGQVRLDAGQHLGGNGRHVDRRPRGLALQHVHDLLGDVNGDIDLRFFRAGSQVRRRDDVGDAQQRVVGGGRLG